MSGFDEALRDALKDKEFRDSYVAENLRRGLAYQIRALRTSRGWTQAEFGRQAGKPHSTIYRWEDPGYGKFSLSTLLEIAAIFDVALSVRFVGFNTLFEQNAVLNHRTLAAPSYEEEVEAPAATPLGGAARAALERQAGMVSASTLADMDYASAWNVAGQVEVNGMGRPQ